MTTEIEFGRRWPATKPTKRSPVVKECWEEGGAVSAPLPLRLRQSPEIFVFHPYAGLKCNIFSQLVCLLSWRMSSGIVIGIKFGIKITDRNVRCLHTMRDPPFFILFRIIYRTIYLQNNILLECCSILQNKHLAYRE